MRFACIDAEKANFPIEMMCRLLRVSRAGFYAWRRRPESRHAERDRELSKRILTIFDVTRETYGSPRITAELRASGEPVGRKRVARLMRMGGLYARRRTRHVQTTDSNHQEAVAPNLLARRFPVGGRRRVWAADITYLPTAQGWLYLAVVLDLRSRAVIGWAMETKVDTELTACALKMALGRSKAPQLHHSDRGAQYASLDYQALLAEHGITCSMSRKGDCWDNAAVESFFSTLKTECLRNQVFPSRREARAEVFRYIEAFYNRLRRHSSLGYRSPAEYEREVLKAA